MTRICKYCGDVYNTSRKHSHTCLKCARENHLEGYKRKVMKKLNLL